MGGICQELKVEILERFLQESFGTRLYMVEVGDEGLGCRCSSVMVCYKWHLHTCTLHPRRVRGRVNRSQWDGLFSSQVGRLMKAAANGRDWLFSGAKRWIRGHLFLRDTHMTRSDAVGDDG